MKTALTTAPGQAALPGTTPTSVHTRINGRASIVESRAHYAQLCPALAETGLSLVLAALVLEADHLRAFAQLHPERAYDEDRRVFYTALATGPLHQFLRRFTAATRAQAQELADTYIIFL